MPRNCTPRPDDFTARVELRPASPPAKGNAISALVRWARAVRDGERQRQDELVGRAAKVQFAESAPPSPGGRPSDPKPPAVRLSELSAVRSEPPREGNLMSTLMLDVDVRKGKPPLERDGV
jgi:hypothetical protein